MTVTLLLFGLPSAGCDVPGPGVEDTANPGTDTGGTTDGASASDSDSSLGTASAESSSGTVDGTVGTEGEELPSVQSIALGSSSTCVVFDDMSTLCWGLDEVTDYEFIGDDEPASAGLPIVEGDVVQVSHSMNLPSNGPSCALRVDGTLNCFEEEVDLGVPSSQVSVGFVHVCAVLETGSVRCWGYGETFSGELGTGDCFADDFDCDASWDTALDVDFGGLAVHVEAGGESTCVLTDLGTVRCWGANGALGNLYPGEYLGDDEVPAVADDVDVGGVVTQIAIGSSHRCALLDTGSVRCWGSNSSGTLGLGHTDTIGDDETPASVGDVDVGASVVQIATGSDHTCALTTMGTVRCWGSNVYGQLGYGDCMVAGWDDSSCNVGDDETPSSKGDVDVGGTVTQIFAGGESTCALLDTGSIRCWGANNYGQLGYGICPATGEYDDLTCSIGDDETPASAGDVPIF